MSNKIKILIADDHEAVREGLKAVFERPDFALVGEANTPDDTVEKTLVIQPDVVIMDIRFPQGSGIEACREIVQNMPSCKVIMLTSYADDEAVFASIMAGASGFVLKQIDSLGLIDAVRSVFKGRVWLDPETTQKVIARVNSFMHDEQVQGRLTPKEKNI